MVKYSKNGSNTVFNSIKILKGEWLNPNLKDSYEIVNKFVKVLKQQQQKERVRGVGTHKYGNGFFGKL